VKPYQIFTGYGDISELQYKRKEGRMEFGELFSCLYQTRDSETAIKRERQKRQRSKIHKM
jgi:hypothetical protein